MPTTKLKNILYRSLLPVRAPSCPRHPFSSVSGHEVIRMKELEYLFRRHHILGGSLLLSTEKEKAILFASSDNPEHIARPGLFFRVASITKMATAVLCMRLVEEGLLDLDALVSSYFVDDAARVALKGITLRHLLSHQSGIIDPAGLESSLVKSVPFPQLLPAARCYAPGEAFHYSNFGFGLVGCIMESILNLPLGTLFQQRLFEPLGMNATLEGCLLKKTDIMPVTRILPYHPGTDVTVTTLGARPLDSPDPLRHFGHTAGSLYTDIISLSKLMYVLIHPGSKYLSASSVSEMSHLHASYGSLSPTLSYGLGLLRIEDSTLSNALILGHQGFAYGCADGAFWEQSTGRCVILLNGGASEARAGRLGLLNRDILRWAFQKELVLW